jgi:hypothetical protein
MGIGFGMRKGGPFPLGSKLGTGGAVVLFLGIHGTENGGSWGKVGSEELADAPVLEDGLVREGTCTRGREVETVMGRGWIEGVDGIWNGGGFWRSRPLYSGMERAV